MGSYSSGQSPERFRQTRGLMQMPDGNSSGNGEAANANAQNNAGADQNQNGSGQGTPAAEEFKVPKRNAEYWDNAKRRRDEARQARADFFKQKPGEGGQGAGEDDDRPLTRGEYQEMQKRDRQQWEEEQEGREMARSTELGITSFLSKPEHAKFQKYEKQARVILADDAYRYADIALIFKGLAHDDALAEGAARGAKADERGARQSIVGSGKRQEPEATGYDPAKHKEFRKNLLKGKASFGAPQ